MANNFITWEQAVKLDVTVPIAQKYEEQIREVIIWFGKNTHAQLLAMEMYMEALELWSVYRNKDYSEFLFKKTEELFDKIEAAKEELGPIGEKLRELAKVSTAAMLKELDNKK